jgi:hypothetical protein
MNRTSITDDVFVSIYYDFMIDFSYDMHLSFEIDRISDCHLLLICINLAI